jgi:hypothetical protein
VIQTFEIRYETAAAVPPPYAHFYHVRASFNRDQLQVDYQLRYLDRDNLSEDEIVGEGFTTNDDVSWQGVLPAVWATEMRQLLEKTKLTNQPANEEEAFLELVLVSENGQSQQGEPVNRAQWEYTAQELIQAIYETASREMPLQLQYKRISPQGDFRRLLLTLRFSTRRVEIRQETPAGKTQREVAWNQLKDLLHIVYMPDYYPENALAKEPVKPGTFLENGEGGWYEFGVSVRNPSRKRDVLKEIQQAFEELIIDN